MRCLNMRVSTGRERTTMETTMTLVSEWVLLAEAVRVEMDGLGPALLLLDLTGIDVVRVPIALTA